MKKLFILALSLGAFSALQAQTVDAAGNEIKSNSNQSGQPAITSSTGTQAQAVTPATPAAKPACAGTAAGSGEVKSCCKSKTASASNAPACAGSGTAAAGQTKSCCKDKAAGASSCAGHAHTGDAAGSAQKPACNKPCTGHAAPAQPAATPVQPNNQ